MTDDKIREACARVLGWAHKDVESNRDIWSCNERGILQAPPRPLDGNTAMALLEHAASKEDVEDALVIDCINDTVFCELDDRTIDLGSVTTRNVILAALVALGEIAPEDLDQG